MAGTPTGRLACRNPNLLAIPKHSDRGKKIRHGFLPPDGYLLGSWDLDQVELRALALGSGDPALVAIFTGGGDIHAETARRIFGVDPERQDKSRHRLPAKAVNFGIPMGISADGLKIQLHKQGQLHYTTEDCQGWLDDWHTKAYPTASAWLYAKVEDCAETGYVTCLGGRRRYLPGVAALDGKIRERAIRQCMSFPMQAGAQHLMHLWEASIYAHITNPATGQGAALPILQIHDDIILALPPSRYESVNRAMQRLLPSGFAVPISAAGQRGETWGAFE